MSLNLENIRDIFSILHDGTIEAFEGDGNCLTLTVKCAYLAKLINGSFSLFYVELIGVAELSLLTWPNPFNLPAQVLSEPKNIFKAKLEILTAYILENAVLITCNQNDTSFDYCGGDLTVSCRSITIYDQSKKELTIEQLDSIRKNYWGKR